MNNIIKHLTTLYEQELYSNIINLCDILITLCEQKQEVTPFIRFQIYQLYADSYFHTQQYTEAEHAYIQAMQVRKYILKPKNAMKMTESQKDNMSDVDIKYKMHICCVKQRQYQRAIEVLQNIPARSRTAKINMALGNLYRDNGSERSAISCYREVLSKNPMCLEAADNLLRLGVKGIEVNSIMLEASADCSWLNSWLRGQAQLYSRDLSNSIATLKSLDTHGLLKNNPTLLTTMATCYTLQCDYTKATSCMQRAFRIVPHMKKGRDLYAFLLATHDDKYSSKELERLANSDMNVNNWSSEQWVVHGYLMFFNKKYERSVYFGQQALILNKKNIEALLLKANAFLQLNNFTEVIRHADEFRQYAPYRFEGHKVLVECYLAMGNHISDALKYALTACKQLNNSPQALTLYASVLIKDPMMTSKVRNYLEKAISADPAYTPAVILLAEHLNQEQRYKEMCALFEKHSEVVTSARIHQMWGDALITLQKDYEAFEQYSTALRIDPNNQRAQEGINNMGRQAEFSGKRNNSFYMTLVDGSSSFVVESASMSTERDHDALEGWPSNQDFVMFE